MIGGTIELHEVTILEYGNMFAKKCINIRYYLIELF